MSKSKHRNKTQEIEENTQEKIENQKTQEEKTGIRKKLENTGRKSKYRKFENTGIIIHKIDRKTQENKKNYKQKILNLYKNYN